MNDKVTFQKKLHEAELAACYISESDMIKISMQEDLLLKELEVLKNLKGLLQHLLRASKDKEIISKQIEELIQQLTDNEMEIARLRNEGTRKEGHLLELSTQLHQEKTIEKKIAEWKLEVVEHKQQILAEKEKREERRNALKRAASVQKQRAEHLKAVVESLISKIRDKEIQLSEALSASNVWKSHYETVIDEKTRLEVQVESLKKQVTDHMMELKRIQDAGRKSRSEIIEKLNAIVSENETISLENTTLKASLAALERSITSAEAELVDLHEEAQQQEMLVEQYKCEVVKLEMEAGELKTRYEKILSDSGKIMEVKDFEMDAVGDSGGVLEQLSLEEENRNIQLKYEEVKKKLEEMELQNKALENQLANKEESLQKTEFQFNQKIADCEALTRQLEAALEDGREKREKHHEVSLKELEHSLQRSENQTQSIQNYVKFLKTSYVTMFG
ncbi:hypothetical protein JD844_017656 [Phrynosoma platyrhinos]|uniref:Outer dense fiber protein 2-like n=1 Tax=Phrynosoma platyrhinos TaxID=52577 RepID=A0ABQ7SM73_PHRPL|nr:hypothetical protein JD844_017656 [Phrynosoma platyrhinos]